MKHRLAIAVTTALALAAGLARGQALVADGAPGTAAPTPAAWPSVPTGANPAFASLPEGHVAPAPSAKPPAFVPADSRVAGFVVVAPPPDQEASMHRSALGVAYLFADAVKAKAFHRGRPDPDDGTATTCFIEDSGSEASGMGEGERPPTPRPPRDWPTQGEATRGMQYQLNSMNEVVRAIRAERLTPDGHGGATLDMTDAWVDAKSHGVKLIGRGTLAMQRVYVGPNGLEVYAAREGGAAHVVVRGGTSPIEGPEAAQQFANARQVVLQLPDGGIEGSDCPHAHLVLRAETGAAQMATLLSTAFLPTLPGDEPVLVEGARTLPDQVAAMRIQALRKRPFAVSVSLSRSSRDPAPVLSIAAGWRGREARLTGS